MLCGRWCFLSQNVYFWQFSEFQFPQHFFIWCCFHSLNVSKMFVWWFLAQAVRPQSFLLSFFMNSIVFIFENSKRITAVCFGVCNYYSTVSIAAHTYLSYASLLFNFCPKWTQQAAVSCLPCISSHTPLQIPWNHFNTAVEKVFNFHTVSYIAQTIWWK